MEYLVETKGNVEERISKVYSISAKNKNEAELIARKQFRNEYNSEVFAVEQVNGKTKNLIVSFILLAFPVFLSLITWRNGITAVKISPDFLSTIYAVFIYGAYFFRFKSNHSYGSGIKIRFGIMDGISAALLIALFSSFVQIFLAEITVPFISVKVNTQYLLIVSIILMYGGMKRISALSFVVIMLIAMIKIATLNTAMGLWGFVYVITSFLGLLIFMMAEPSFIEFTKNFGRGTTYILKESVKVSGNTVKQVATSAKNKIEMMADGVSDHE